MSSSEFYDNYLSYHVRSGINDRIYSLFRRLCKHGLKKEETILEIGCGIGTLTYLLAKKVTKGKIEAIDISPKSIAYAGKHITQRNISFSATDVQSYLPSCAYFDKILLFDVLEHIPVEEHTVVFNRISSWLNEDGFLFINLPNPEYILFDQKNNPEALQEIDQPLFLHQLLPVFVNCSLELIFFESHSVWVKDDYHFLILRKKQVFKEELLSEKRNVLAKGFVRLGRILRKIRHPYPEKIKPSQRVFSTAGKRSQDKIVER